MYISPKTPATQDAPSDCAAPDSLSSSSPSPLHAPPAVAPGADAPRVVVSLDVEEEGLFSGQYASSGCGVRNVALLERLLPLTRELGFPLTLLCAHTVFADADARRMVLRLRDEAGAEIGAHLHHWSTPPLSDPPPAADGAAASGGPPRTDTLPRELLRRRLRTLLDAGQAATGAPLTSFRMGRWDLKSVVRPLLAQEGILVDSSVCPLRRFGSDGPDHFLAPADPYRPVSPHEKGDLLEVPITQVPLSPALARLWYRCLRGRRQLDAFRFFGALSPNPVWHGPAVMRLATRLHLARGGRVISLFWHSSEMLPGASPNIPDQAAADALLARVREYLLWLRQVHGAQGVTLSSLYDDGSFPALAVPQGRTGPLPSGDW